ncbi:YTH domain-containing protein ECT4-like [Andrographis paniculata]|uniref:YTH domain-containing protein ECT4-like n=1 Tax=Andrographis paniculata TaxID=175694 RepID=UPI0021E871C9|nr:YTH domain-containing protein ECT4-like [Andrographis paniculata]XP_051132076.1 YTH domain-containing protein ECT4-like [Andrographis paniculata]
MEDANQQSRDRFAPISSPGAGDTTVELHNLTEQPLSPKDERIVSGTPPLNAAIPAVSRSSKDKTATSGTSGTISKMQPFNSYTPVEQGYYFGGYENGSGNWDEHSSYVNANNLHVMQPAMYNENSSIIYHPGYGFDSQMAYGQFSPLPSPMSPIVIDGQLFPPHQMPVAPSYYAPSVSPGPPHVTSAHPVSQPELMASGSNNQENFVDNAFFGPGSGYYVPLGPFSGELSGNSGLGLYNFPGELGSSEPLPSSSSSLDTSRFMSPLASGTLYPQPIGVLGSYEQNVAQASFQGFGLTSSSSSRRLPHVNSYQSTVGSGYNRNRFVGDNSGRREKEQGTANVSADALALSSDRNRGPRSSKPKSKSFPEDGSSAGTKAVESTSGIQIHSVNSPDFITEYERAKFFVIKSFNEDNIHKSIKYSVWASTPLGNRKLDAAYQESKEMEGVCPVFLFFSVNASGQFCGVAEMVGHVDFEKDADYWQQDRWSGQFPVKWHMIKDVPNSRFRHILLENNDNKPVTHSRDAQEVKLEQGVEMLKIFKNHDADTSLLDDFNFYDEREKALVERKAKHRTSSTGNTTTGLAKDSINQLSNNLADTLHLDGGKKLPKVELE